MSETGFIQIEPTTRCNFTCSFCPGRHLKQHDMDFALFESVMDMFNDVKFVQLYGEGEPLLHNDFFRMARLAVGMGAAVSTVTNGSLLRNRIDDVIDSGLRSVHISLESTDPQVFRTIRGGDVEAIFASIDNLVQRKRELGSETPFVGFSVTVLRSTLHEIDSICSKYNKFSMDGGIIIQPLNEMSSYTKNYTDDVNSQMLQMSDVEFINETLSNNMILKDIQKNKKLGQTFFEALRSNVNSMEHGCPWLLRSLFVNAEGFVMPCSMIKNVDTYSFGHMLNDSRSTILFRRRKMLQMVLDGSIPDVCNNCRTLDSNYKPGFVHR